MACANFSEPCCVVTRSQNFPSDIAKIKTNVGGNLIVYELPETSSQIAATSAGHDERQGSHTSTPPHQRYHGDQQQQQQQQWGLGHIQRGLASEYFGTSL